jgi:CheY-like chemotaxis protein
MASREQPDLILLDWRLPDIDGGEVTRNLKSSEQTKHIPILVVTANAFSKDEELAREAGCDEFETKPFDFPQLLSKMKTLLQQRERND